jgi:hypothetical protein
MNEQRGKNREDSLSARPYRASHSSFGTVCFDFFTTGNGRSEVDLTYLPRRWGVTASCASYAGNWVTA